MGTQVKAEKELANSLKTPYLYFINDVSNHCAIVMFDIVCFLYFTCDLYKIVEVIS